MDPSRAANAARSQPLCGLCGEPAKGLAKLNGVRYCHGDDQDPTCYQLAQWALSGALERILAALPEEGSDD